MKSCDINVDSATSRDDFKINKSPAALSYQSGSKRCVTYNYVVVNKTEYKYCTRLYNF